MDDGEPKRESAKTASSHAENAQPPTKGTGNVLPQDRSTKIVTFSSSPVPPPTTPSVATKTPRHPPTSTPMGLPIVPTNKVSSHLGKHPHPNAQHALHQQHPISTLVSATKPPTGSVEGRNQKTTPATRRKKSGRGRRFSSAKQKSESNGGEKKHRGTRTGVEDEDPSRIVNPLVDIPPVECMEEHMATEMSVWTDIVFGKADTYPLSYYARLLGFDVSAAPPDRYVALDPSTITLKKDIPAIPSMGSKLWYKNDIDLDYQDPVYKALSHETSNVVETLRRANLHVSNRFLKQECLQTAKEVLGDDLPDFMLDDKGDFGIRASDGTCIRYQFMWYQFKSGDEGKGENTKIGPYGVTALASHIKKPQVAELMVYIKWLGKGEPLIEKKSHAITSGKDSSLKKCATTVGTSSREDKESSSQLVANLPTSNVKNSVGETIISSDAKEKNEENGAKPPAQGQTGDDFKLDERVLIVLTALALEHARASDILYGIAEAPGATTALFTKYFRMTPLKSVDSTAPPTLACDLHQSSSKYAFHLYKEPQDQDSHRINEDDRDIRMLVRLPFAERVKAAMDRSSKPASKTSRNLKYKNTHIASAAEPLRSRGLTIRADMSSKDDNIKLLHNGSTGELKLVDSKQAHSWDIFRIFQTDCNNADRDKPDPILEAVTQKRDELVSLESAMEPILRSLLRKVVDDRMAFEKARVTRLEEMDVLNGYQAILDRRKELDMAVQKQRDQDMDAVCEICMDGEVTPDNQILFCEACNVAVHQFCYGIEKIPQGDYYCIACRFFGRDTSNSDRDSTMKIAPSPLPINCELCPQRKGAFIRSDTSTQLVDTNAPKLSKWVHVLCAKWQGLNFVDSQKKDCVEDVVELKRSFRMHEIKCHLCEGDRGAFHECRAEGCHRWMHITCARAFGECEVIHGENCAGEVENNPWTLKCPEHSEVEKSPGSVSIEKLQLLAKAFPPEPKVEKPKPKVNKAFGKMTGTERREFLADLQNEAEFVNELLTKKLHGVRCEVCYTLEDEGKNLTKCIDCAIIFCDSCKMECDHQENEKHFKCAKCQFLEEALTKHGEVETPNCVLCFERGGWLRMARGAPMKKWKKERQKEFEKTLFDKRLWTHALCALWQYPLLYWDDIRQQIRLDNVIMTHGRSFILNNSRCELCGQHGGLKMKCAYPNCRQRGALGRPSIVHVTCARRAGFQVDNRQSLKTPVDTEFFVHCYRHSSCEFAFRARLEDLIELERSRIGKRLEQDSKTMSLNHASRLLNSSIVVASYLGWAWRWAEWWVEYGSNWEPLIEPGQNEKNMTKEELKIIDSTPESRCADARRCRLAAFGAALRNRAYDDVKDGSTIMLDKALRAVLNTKSLVGPLTPVEIDFYAQWIGIAYRSKSRFLGFGGDAIIVDESSPSCLHEDDKSPKYILNGRSIPGQQVLPEGQTFESDVKEIDDFLKPERLEDGRLYSEVEHEKKTSQKENQKKRKSSSSSGKKLPGRPRKDPRDEDTYPEVIQTKPKRGRPPKSHRIEEPESALAMTTIASSMTQSVPSEQPSLKRFRKPTFKADTSDESPITGSVVAPAAIVPPEHAKKVETKQKSVHRKHSSNINNEASLLSINEKRTSLSSRISDDDAIVDNGTTEKGEIDVSRKRPASEVSGDEDGGGRGRRKKLAPATYNEDALFEFDIPHEEKMSTRKGGKSKSVADKNETVNAVDGEVIEKNSSRGRRKSAPVSYRESDSVASDLDERSKEVFENPLANRRSKTKVFKVQDDSVDEHNVRPRSRNADLAETPRDDDEDALPLSAFVIPRKKKLIRVPREEDLPEPEPDLTSPQKRGRHRGKLEASRTIL